MVYVNIINLFYNYVWIRGWVNNYGCFGVLGEIDMLIRGWDIWYLGLVVILYFYNYFNLRFILVFGGFFRLKLFCGRNYIICEGEVGMLGT